MISRIFGPSLALALVHLSISMVHPYSQAMTLRIRRGTFLQPLPGIFLIGRARIGSLCCGKEPAAALPSSSCLGRGKGSSFFCLPSSDSFLGPWWRSLGGGLGTLSSSNLGGRRRHRHDSRHHSPFAACNTHLLTKSFWPRCEGHQFPKQSTPHPRTVLGNSVTQQSSTGRDGKSVLTEFPCMAHELCLMA